MKDQGKNHLAKPQEVPEAISKAKAVLTKQQADFADLVLDGIPLYKAFLQAYNKTTMLNDSASSRGSAVLRTQCVHNYVRAVRDHDFKQNQLSREEKLSFLADTVRTSASELVDSNGNIKQSKRHLVQEYTVTETRQGTVTKVKMPSKAEAIRLDNAMTGDDAPIRVDHSLSLASIMDNAKESKDIQTYDFDDFD